LQIPQGAYAYFCPCGPQHAAVGESRLNITFQLPARLPLRSEVTLNPQPSTPNPKPYTLMQTASMSRAAIAGRLLFHPCPPSLPACPLSPCPLSSWPLSPCPLLLPSLAMHACSPLNNTSPPPVRCLGLLCLSCLVCDLLVSMGCPVLNPKP
jgi:hypothetical protein